MTHPAMLPTMNIGETIRNYRLQKGMSQGDIEKRTGLLRCYLSRVENGHTIPSLDTLSKIALALDLPIALALASSLRDRPVATGTIAIGEVGLLGELRPVPGLERRLHEAARLGFTRAIVPAAAPRAGRDAVVEGMTVVPVDTLREAVDSALQPVVGRVAGTPARC